jgi:hypothetical protein
VRDGRARRERGVRVIMMMREREEFVQKVRNYCSSIRTIELMFRAPMEDVRMARWRCTNEWKRARRSGDARATPPMLNFTLFRSLHELFLNNPSRLLPIICPFFTLQNPSPSILITSFVHSYTHSIISRSFIDRHCHTCLNHILLAHFLTGTDSIPNIIRCLPPAP